MTSTAMRLTRLTGRTVRLPDDAAIARRLTGRDAWLRYRKPRYQLQMITDLAQLLPEGECRVLDIGAGSGLIGETIAVSFAGKSVTGVDIAGKVLPDLGIPFVRFDGERLPFAERSFDCALLCNMLHHVKPTGRLPLLREALRVTGGGPLIIKDHLPRGALDHLRLYILDVLGNMPRGAMVSARYLDYGEWESLLEALGCTGELLPVGSYRAGVWASCFPNRLEICLRVTAADSP